MMRMPCLSIAMLLVLAACGAAKPYKAQPVDIAVTTPCRFDIPAAPRYMLQLLPKKAALTEKTKAMISDLNTAKADASMLRAAMGACNGGSDLYAPAIGAKGAAPEN